MANTKHTPGPWKVSLGITEYETICTLCPTPSWKPMRIDGPRPILSDETEHNARMIAAAPELLELCERMIEVIEYNDHKLNVSDLKADILAAIAKAKGE